MIERKPMALEAMVRKYFPEREAPIPLADITSTTEEEWAAGWRQHGPFWADPSHPNYIEFTIGGSDTARIMGVSPWGTKLELYDQKTGRDPKIKVEMNAQAKEGGHIYEPFVAEMLAKKLAKMDWIKSFELIDDTFMYRCGQKNEYGCLKYPWAIADFDRLAIINGEPYIVELKTTSYKNVKGVSVWERGAVPVYYETQVRHYMAVANIDHAVVCCAWGFTEDTTQVVFMDRDMELEEALMKEEGNFIDHCVCGIEPEEDESTPALMMKYYTRRYGDVDKKLPPVTLDPAYKEQVRKIMAAEDMIKLAEDELDRAKEDFYKECNELIQAFVTPDGDLASYASLDDEETGERIGITLKLPMKRTKIDAEKLKAECPDVYGECVDYSVSVTKLKKCATRDKIPYAEKYALPQEAVDDPKYTFAIKVKPIPLMKAGKKAAVT